MHLLTAARPSADGKGTASFSSDALLLLVALLPGLLVRVVLVAPADFPLHDGGLFYVMVQDLQRSHFLLPRYTSYNGGDIPFGYPPLAFYVVALLSSLTNASLTALFCIVPLVVSVLEVVAFGLLARALLRSRVAAAGAMLAFGLLPMGFEWLVMGGGLTRSFGALFSLLTLHQVYRLYTTRQSHHVPFAILFATLTVLSHLEWTWFAVYTTVLLFLCYGRHRSGVVHSALIGACTLALTAPWWATVLLRFGVAPFIAVLTGSSHEWPWYVGIVSLLSLNLGIEDAFPLIQVFGFVGLVRCLTARRWLIPAWLLTICVLDSRGLPDRIVVPIALLAGVSLDEWFLPALSGDLVRPWVRRPLLAFPLIFAMLAAVVSVQPLLSPLSRDDRAAMQWVAAQTPSGSAFLVLSPEAWFGADRTSEWFPALTERRSVLTVQGYEWVGGGAFARRDDGYRAVRQCLDVECLEQWAQKTGTTFQYLYVVARSPILPQAFDASVCCAAVHASLQHDARYVQVYTGGGVAIFRRTD